MRKSEFKKYPDKMQKNLCLSGYFLNNWKFQGNRVSIGFNIYLTKSMHLMHHRMYIFDTNACPVYKLIRNSDRILDGNTGRCLSVFRNQKNRQIRMGIFFALETRLSIIRPAKSVHICICTGSQWSFSIET